MGDKVTISESQTEGGEKRGKVVSDVVKILLGIYKLVEGNDTITSKETMVGSGVQPRIRTTDVVWSRLSELVVGVN